MCSSLIFLCVLAGTNNAVWTQAWRIVRKTKTYFALRFCIDYYALNKPYNNHQSDNFKIQCNYKSFSFSSIKSLYRLIMVRLLAISYTNIQLWNSTIGFKNLNRSCFFWTELRQMINWKIIAVLCKVNVDANQLEIFKVQIHLHSDTRVSKIEAATGELWTGFFYLIIAKNCTRTCISFCKTANPDSNSTNSLLQLKLENTY